MPTSSYDPYLGRTTRELDLRSVHPINFSPIDEIMFVARDLMTQPVITVAPNATLEEATELLLENNISGLPVVGSAGQIVGMFSELDEGKPVGELLSIICGYPILDDEGQNVGNVSGFDEVRRYVRDRAAHQVKDYMTTEVVLVNEDDPATRVVDLFVSHQVHRLPVMRGNELVGVIGIRDVVRFIRELESKLGVTS